jgi:hypothetical protein
MNLDQEEKTFTKEDLDLVKDDTADGSDAGSSDETSDDVSDKSADGTAEETSADGSDESTAGDDAADDKAQSQDDKGTSLLDDIDDDGEVIDRDKKDETADKKDDDKSDDDEKKDEKSEKDDDKSDWRKNLVDYVLKGKENELTASKLTKRRDALTKELSRFKSQEEFMRAGIAAREKIRSGEYKRSKLSEDATEEEVAAWRRDNNIPPVAKDYDIPKVPGHQWDDVDVPFIDSFKDAAYKANYSQDQMNAAAEWYAKTLANQQAEYAETITVQDQTDKESLRDELRARLGPPEFKSSLILMDRLLKDDDVIPGHMAKALMNARYTDDEGRSRRLINNGEMVNFLMDFARDTYGDAVIVSGDGRVSGNDRKKEIEKIMETDIKEYYRQGLDKEYLEITEREEKRGRRRERA